MPAPGRAAVHADVAREDAQGRDLDAMRQTHVADDGAGSTDRERECE